MESDQYLHDRGSLPPPPPPKLNLESPISPDLPLTHPDHLKSRSPSRPSSPLRHSDSVLSPLVNEAEALLIPPSPNRGTDDSFLEPPSPSPSPSPSTSSFKGKQGKKSNPFTDLVESEREYIDLLASIIRKVAGAWSRTNFPPKQLDVMFRGIEAVYKANKGLLNKLKDIGATPTSPKALGDLLMRWIDDLDAPYTRYCNNFAVGFDEWRPVASNTRLPPILTALSAVHPPPPPPGDPEPSTPSTWTLDVLFALPRGRLKYYKKLYTRLLKSTQAGRSDHKLLTGAVDRLENLLVMLTGRESIVVGEENEKNLPLADPGTYSPTGDKTQNWTERVVSNVSGSETTEEQARGSVGSSVPHSSLSSERPVSRDAEFSRAGGKTTSSATMSMPISDLERRLSTERTLDIFTLKPKAVRLQMNPPSLPFTRALRLSQQVEIHFTPRFAPDSPRVHVRGHIFLLTDLFLVCERMTSDERQKANSESDGQEYDMWLLYPPLAGKHLRVSEHSEQENVLQIQILRKETLLLHTESKAARDHLTQELKDCIEAATLLSPRPGQPPPPPVPPLPSTSDSMTQERQERDRALNINATASFVASPLTSSNTSPQLSDQGRPHEELPEPTRHPSFPIEPEVQQSTSPVIKGLPTLPSVEVSSTDFRGDEMSPSSSSQPQLQSPHQFQQTQQTFNTSSHTPFIPPPRGTSYSQLVVPTAVGPPARPATAPGQPQFGGSSPQFTYPGQYPSRMQTSSPAYSLQGPYPNGQGATLGSGRPPSDPMANAPLRKSPSAQSLGSQPLGGAPPPVPGHPAFPGRGQFHGGFHSHNGSVNFPAMPHMYQPHPRVPFPSSTTFNQRVNSFVTTSSWGPPTREPSPPNSPSDEEPVSKGPVISSIVAQFKCKVFLQLHHGQWKSLGGARLKLYLQQPTNVKQLVVEADSKDKAMLISTIVLTDGVERVGKTGVAIELSDKGARTGIVYMIQLRNEVSASGLFDSLLAGSDRAAGRAGNGQK